MKSKIAIGSLLSFFALLFSFFLTSPQAYAQCNMAAMPFTATTGANGQVNLMWGQTPPIAQFSLVYGLSPNNYQFGVPSFSGDTRMFTVSALNPGARYFFQVWSFCDSNGPAAQSAEVNAVAGGGMMMQSSTTTTMQASPTPTPTK